VSQSTLQIDESLQGIKSRRLRALIVDDDHYVRRVLSTVLEAQGWVVGEAESIARAHKLFAEEAWNLIYLDKCLPDGDGIAFLEFVNQQETDTKVIMITGQGSTQEAMLVVTMDACFDYLTKPVSSDAILLQLHKFVESLEDEEDDIRTPLPFVEQGLVGRSASMIEVAKEIQRVAPTDRRVLITGGSGTGKEVVAREIYKKSLRANRPFVSVNCGAINKELIESELFGHEKGAFTGAHTERTGLFQEAHQGTIFLDEITETPADFQVKLLRALQEGEIRKVGSNRVVKIDVRVIAASNRDIEKDVAQGIFRTDLYYRLNQSHIHLPPLRERTEDILPLVDYFVAREAQRMGREIVYANAVLDLLYQYDWEGNVRELEHAIIQAASVCKNGVIRINDLPAKIKEIALKKVTTGDPIMIGTSEDFIPLAELEGRYMDQVIAAKGGNLSEAARTLGINRKTLERRQEKIRQRSEKISADVTDMTQQLVREHKLNEL
jgi:two-component system, NtrC family, response regulator AtoC